jgi:plastocyanin
VTIPRVVGLVVAAAALGGCGGGAAGADGGGSSSSEPAVVDIRTFAFEPDPLETSAGTEVRFVNHDAVGHTVTAGTRKKPGGSFDEKLAATKGEATITFSKPGRYSYFCSLHPGPGMTGAVIVR